MKKLKIAELLQKAQSVVLRYPMVLLMSFIMATVVVQLIKLDAYQKEWDWVLTKFAFVSSLGISVMFALKMFSQRIGKEWLLNTLGLVFLIGFYFIFPSDKKDFTDVYVFILFPTYVLAHLLVAFVAFLNRTNSEENFWQYNKSLFVNFVLTLIFTNVLTGGVELAVVSVEHLFNFNFDNKIYPQIFFSFSIFGSTFIFLLFCETGLKTLELQGEYPVVLKFFTQFILIPLLFIYVIILYLYAGKILIAWELPRGWVSYLVLAYASVGILALLLVHPLKKENTKSWVKNFGNVFYYSLIPLLVLLFVAIFTRVLAYGFTEARYFVLLLALWLASVVFYFVFNKKASIQFIPVSLFSFGLFALIFPYLNAFSTSKRSQKTELEKILTENNLLKDGKIDFDASIADSVANDVNSKFKYLRERLKQDYLKQYLTDTIYSELQDDNYWYIRKYFSNIQYSNNKGNEYLNLGNKNNSFEIDKGLFMVRLDKYSGEEDFSINEDDFLLKKDLWGKNITFKLTLNDKETVDLLPELKKLFSDNKAQEGHFETDKLFIKTALGNYDITIWFSSIDRNYNRKKDEYSYNIYGTTLIIQERE